MNEEGEEGVEERRVKDEGIGRTDTRKKKGKSLGGSKIKEMILEHT